MFRGLVRGIRGRIRKCYGKKVRNFDGKKVRNFELRLVFHV